VSDERSAVMWLYDRGVDLPTHLHRDVEGTKSNHTHQQQQQKMSQRRESSVTNPLNDIPQHRKPVPTTSPEVSGRNTT